MPKGDEMSLLGVTGERSREFMIAAARERGAGKRERGAHRPARCSSLSRAGPFALVGQVCVFVCAAGAAHSTSCLCRPSDYEAAERVVRCGRGATGPEMRGGMFCLVRKKCEVIKKRYLFLYSLLTLVLAIVTAPLVRAGLHPAPVVVVLARGC